MEKAQLDQIAAESGSIDLLDLAIALAERIRLLLWMPLFAGAIALGISFLIPPTYTAVVRMLPPLQPQSSATAIAAQLGALAGLTGSTIGIKTPADQYVALLKSRTVLDAIIRRFNLRQLFEVEYQVDARRLLHARTRITVGPKDGIISIEFDDLDPKRAADIANAFVDELRNLSKTLAVTEAAQRRLFFESQLVKAKDNLALSETALHRSGVSEATLKTVPQSALEGLARLQAQITAQEVKLASMRAYMTESNPEFTVALRELAALRSELLKAERNDTSKAGANGVEYIGKYRDFKYHEALFELMSKQYELARLDEAREGAVIQVVDAAEPPERKSKPRKAYIAVGTTLVVLFLLTLYVLVQRAIQNLSRRPASAAKFSRLKRMIALRRE